MRIGLRLLAFTLVGLSCLCVEGADAKIIKVLPHYLDLEGRHSLSPSLYERDAYQAHLRKNPDQRAALRFDVQWRARGIAGSNLRLRLEVRTSKNILTKPAVFEQLVQRRRWLSRWSALLVAGDDYQRLGEILAWRATLWDGERLLAEQRSFLWQDGRP